MNLRDWDRWLSEAREAGMWEDHPRLPDWYERDPLDERASDPPTRIEDSTVPRRAV